MPHSTSDRMCEASSLSRMQALNNCVRDRREDDWTKREGEKEKGELRRTEEHRRMT